MLPCASQVRPEEPTGYVILCVSVIVNEHWAITLGSTKTSLRDPELRPLTCAVPKLINDHVPVLLFGHCIITASINQRGDTPHDARSVNAPVTWERHQLMKSAVRPSQLLPITVLIRIATCAQESAGAPGRGEGGGSTRTETQYTDPHSQLLGQESATFFFPARKVQRINQLTQFLSGVSEIEIWILWW